jgi:signal peptidase I
VWLKPRQTIEHVLATQPRQRVWLLASLGAIAGFAGQILGFGLTSQLFDWASCSRWSLRASWYRQPFNSPSGSMAPTLLVGDYYFVSKYAYGYSHYSLPFSPRLFSGRILGSEPARGDVAVFRLPKDDSVDYVKRVVGLPGDRIQMKQGMLYINDVAVARERLADFVGANPCGSDPNVHVKRWRETLPNGVSYETPDCIDNGFYDNTIIYTVPAGCFFLIGDNRDNSTDSRVLSAVGYVPLENFIGWVGMIFYSKADGSEATASAVRSERVGTIVH